MYNPQNQYRCTIIRGKSKQAMDDLLPAYAKIIQDICPCEQNIFNMHFNNELSAFIRSATNKTLDNHRTEIVGKLFGMYYVSEDGFVYSSERTKKFLEDNDQPAFFKDICFKMQFPNGMDKINNIIDRINQNISIRQYPYLLKILLIAQNNSLILTKKDIGYYVLNSLEVLQSKANPQEVICQILKDRKDGFTSRVSTPNHATSYDFQHINEQINYLELANLITTSSSGDVFLNMNESKIIEYFASYWDCPPMFDVYSYRLNSPQERKKFELDWGYHYSKLSENSEMFVTTTASLGINEHTQITEGRTDLVSIGDDGELYVFQYEKQRVKTFNARLAAKVLHLGKTKGLGYDIQSVIAEDGDMAEFVKYIEVKSTKRVTAPDVRDTTWVDTLNITRNEWVAAQQHKDFYSIFRVYFVRGKVIMYIIQNVQQKENDGHLKIVPTTYRVDFSMSAVDLVIS